MAKAIGYAMLVLWIAIALGFAWAMVSVHLADRRAARQVTNEHWTDRDDRAVQLEAKRHDR